jgi:hypothetical protein
LRLVICERGRRRSPHTPRPFVSVAATRPSAPGGCCVKGSDSVVRLQAASDRAAGKHLDDSRNHGKAGRRPVAHDARVAGEANSCASGETQDATPRCGRALLPRPRGYRVGRPLGDNGRSGSWPSSCATSAPTDQLLRRLALARIELQRHVGSDRLLTTALMRGTMAV